MKSMNRIVLLTLIIVIFINMNCYSQYQSLFGNEKTSWNVKTSQLFGPVLDSFVYEKDTMLFNIKHKKFNFFRNNGSITGELFITEDIISGKAFYKVYNDIQGWREYQIYDLSLNEGDSYNFKGMDVAVERIEIIDNTKYIYLDYYANSRDNIKFTMIEGVGTNIGIAYHCDITLGCLFPILLCQEKDDVKTYINDYGIYSGQCNFDDIDLSVDKESGNKINIYPNPSNSIINIKEANGGDIIILNMLGQEILKIANISDNQKVDVSHFNPGTYYIRILKDNSIFTSKVVIAK